MLDTRLGRIFWHIAGRLDYWLTLTKFRILDALAGTEPETPADLQRRHDQERIERAFPKIGPVEAPRRTFPKADHRRPR